MIFISYRQQLWDNELYRMGQGPLIVHHDRPCTFIGLANELPLDPLHQARTAYILSDGRPNMATGVKKDDVQSGRLCLQDIYFIDALKVPDVDSIQVQ